MCSGRSKNGRLWTTFFLGRLRRFPSVPVPSTRVVDSGSGRESETSCDTCTGGAGNRRVVLQFRHESLTDLPCEDKAAPRHVVFSVIPVDEIAETYILTGRSPSSQVSGGNHNPCISSVSQMGPYKIQRFLQSSRKKKTNNFTTVFRPMAFIELTYDLDRYVGVTTDALPLCFFSLFLSDGLMGLVVGWVAWHWVVGRDDNQVLAWYKKFNLCMISLFGTL